MKLLEKLSSIPWWIYGLLLVVIVLSYVFAPANTMMVVNILLGSLISTMIFFIVVYVNYIVAVICLAIAMFFFAKLLANDPNRKKPTPEEVLENPELQAVVDERRYSLDDWGYFTELQPGEQKTIVRAGTPFRVILDHPGHTFYGYTDDGMADENLDSDDPEFWQVVPTPKGEKDASPVYDERHIRWDKSRKDGPITQFVSKMFYVPWYHAKHWVFKKTGFIFTGFSWFQGVYAYAIEWYRKSTDKDVGEDGNIVLDRQLDFSDKFYAKPVPFWFAIGSSDTKDKAPVRLYMMLIIEVCNCYKLQYRTKDWSSSVIGIVSDTVNNVTRKHGLAQLISNEDLNGSGKDEVTEEISEAIRGLSNEKDESEDIEEGLLLEYGIRIKEVFIPDRSPATKELEEALQLEVNATLERKATIITAEGNAESTKINAEALRASGAPGAFAANLKNKIDVADAAGNKAIITIGADDRSDPALLALLKETRESNEGGQDHV